MGFGPPYQHIYANDKRIYPFYEVAAEHNVVVYYHHGGGIGAAAGPAYNAPLKYAKPILLDDVVIDFPNLRINVEHMAYPWTEVINTCFQLHKELLCKSLREKPIDLRRLSIDIFFKISKLSVM